MRCPNCGQRLADEARKCPVCGTVIDEIVRINIPEKQAEETKISYAGEDVSGQSSETEEHHSFVSGAAALCGEAIVGHHAEGRYYLTKSRKELGYYTARAQELLSAARPLMDIYRIDNKNEFNAFLQVDSEAC